jgi:hypothetical protein
VTALEAMTVLDKRCILALQPVTGLSVPARRLADQLAYELRLGRPIAPGRRGALYAVCWRHREQLPMALQVKVAIASADALAQAVLNDRPSHIRGVRMGGRIG